MGRWDGGSSARVGVVKRAMRALRGYVVGGVGVVGGSAPAVKAGGSALGDRGDVVAIDEAHARHLSTQIGHDA